MGVNEYGIRPKRLVEPMNRINEISIRDHVRPLTLWISSICLRMS